MGRGQNANSLLYGPPIQKPIQALTNLGRWSRLRRRQPEQVALEIAQIYRDEVVAACLDFTIAEMMMREIERKLKLPKPEPRLDLEPELAEVEAEWAKLRKSRIKLSQPKTCSWGPHPRPLTLALNYFSADGRLLVGDLYNVQIAELVSFAARLENGEQFVELELSRSGTGFGPHLPLYEE